MDSGNWLASSRLDTSAPNQAFQDCTPMWACMRTGFDEPSKLIMLSVDGETMASEEDALFTSTKDCAMDNFVPDLIKNIYES